MAEIEHGTLTATTVATVSFADEAGTDYEVPNIYAPGGVVTVNRRGKFTAVTITNHGTVPIYATTDGTNPTVGGDDFEVIPAGGTRRLGIPSADTASVKLISSGTPSYTVKAG